MTIKASGPSILIVTTGLLACLAGPSLAEEVIETTASIPSITSENAGAAHPAAILARTAAEAARAPDAPSTPSARHHERSAHGKSGKTVSKSSARKKAVAADDTDNSSTILPSAIPPSVANANANAELPPAGPRIVHTEVIRADRLNDLDRALQERTQPAAVSPAVASSDRPVAPAAPVVFGGHERANGEHALIGEIFIGIGALLTVASAARMLI
jgi:hypothetical protein